MSEELEGNNDISFLSTPLLNSTIGKDLRSQTLFFAHSVEWLPF
jgi:hypothetical protein